MKYSLIAENVFQAINGKLGPQERINMATSSEFQTKNAIKKLPIHSFFMLVKNKKKFTTV